MAIKKVKNHSYIADTFKDLQAIEVVEMGAQCYIIKEASLYEQLSTGEWIRQSGSNYSNLLAFSGQQSTAEGSVDLSGYATEKYVDEKVEAIEIPSIEGFAKEEDVQAIAENPILKAFDFSRNPSKEDGQAIYLTANDSTTLVEALKNKGLGVYNIWMGKGRTDLPQTMITGNTSGRGFACVDLQTKADPTNFIAYVILFDKNNNMFYQFISHGTAGSWMKVSAEQD